MKENEICLCIMFIKEKMNRIFYFAIMTSVFHNFDLLPHNYKERSSDT